MNGLAEFIFTCRVPHVTIVTEKRFSFNHIPGYLVRLSLKNVTNAKLNISLFLRFIIHNRFSLWAPRL